MSTPYAHLVVDANVFITGTISGASFARLAARFWTTDDVLRELRDARARGIIDLLPFTVETREPSESSLSFVSAFAAQTGDLSRLSRTDLRLLALTHQLERECNASSFLREAPPTSVTRAALPGRPTLPCRYHASATGCRAGNACKFAHVDSAIVSAAAASDGGSSVLVDEPAAAGGGEDDGEGEWIVPTRRGAGRGTGVGWDDSVESIPFGHERVMVTGAAGEDGDSAVTALGATTAAVVPPVAEAEGEVEAVTAALAVAGVDAAGEEDDSSDTDDDDEGDATPAGAAAVEVGAGPARVPVCLMTTDFAMQNCALQMGLLLASHSGKLIRSVHSWVLKCDACFTITDDMQRIFCPRCGNAALARLGVTLGPDGAPRYHYKRNRVVNTRGTIYAIPAAKGGRDGAAKDLLLREDQLLTGSWAQKVKQKAAEAARETGMFADRAPGDDWMSSAAAASHRVRGNDLRRAGDLPDVVYGFGRKNPNARGRKRR